MVQVPIQFPIPTEQVIASFDFTDIAIGLGFSIFHLTLSEDSNVKTSLLAPSTLPSASTTGLAKVGNPYEFRTSAFNLPRTVKGTAYVSGYANYDADDLVGTAQISIEDAPLVLLGLGSIQWSNLSEVSHGTNTFTLKKTITINGYVNKINSQINAAGGGRNETKYIFFYDGENTYEEIEGTTSTSYVSASVTNPNPGKFVYKIEVWLRDTFGFDSSFEKDTEVYEETKSGRVATPISESVVTATMSADQGILLELPLTETNIKKGENIVLTFQVTGASGGFVLDPTGEIETKESLKLNLPFKIDI